jgi:hypothetical protein
MGEVVPRSGTGSLIKIVICESFKKSWACKLARRVGVKSVSRCCVQVLVSVTVHCS